MKSTENHYRALMISSVSNDGIHTRDYFHKDLKKVFIGKKKQIFTDKKNLKGFS